ncbi:MAG: prephenate dehydratase [Terriglobia bacterium]
MPKKKLNRPMIAFQGERGAYSELAARRLFPRDPQLSPCQTFDLVFQKVDRGEVDFGVIPIENSLAGSIHQNYDLLLRYDLQILGELNQRIVHNLIAHPAATLPKIRRVYSHPQALMQCQRNLSRFKNIEVIPTYDTAGSVKKIKEEDIFDGAAIASTLAAEIYGMKILKSQIQDDPENFTRFLVLGQKTTIPKRADKTSVVFSVQNIPGALFRALSVFALRDIDLYKIESRPLYGKPWEYLFYIDFAGSEGDAKCRHALQHLNEVASFWRVLGSYQRDEQTA